jgi:hypothetical protein
MTASIKAHGPSSGAICTLATQFDVQINQRKKFDNKKTRPALRCIHGCSPFDPKSPPGWGRADRCGAILDTESHMAKVGPTQFQSGAALPVMARRRREKRAARH